MTKIEAKELSHKLWSYLRDNSDCVNKDDTPYWDAVENLVSHCPLCEVFIDVILDAAGLPYWTCGACQLVSCGRDSAWAQWETAECAADRRDAAARIVDAIEAWDITGVDQ